MRDFLLWAGTRTAFLLVAALVLFFAHWIESGRAVAILVACGAIVAALAHYGHTSVTKWQAEQRRSLQRVDRELTTMVK